MRTLKKELCPAIYLSTSVTVFYIFFTTVIVYYILLKLVIVLVITRYIWYFIFSDNRYSILHSSLTQTRQTSSTTNVFGCPNSLISAQWHSACLLSNIKMSSRQLITLVISSGKFLIKNRKHHISCSSVTLVDS